jgi:hypothetical protein
LFFSGPVTVRSNVPIAAKEGAECVDPCSRTVDGSSRRASDQPNDGKSLWDFVVFSQAVTVRSTAGLCRFLTSFRLWTWFFSGGDGAFFSPDENIENSAKFIDPYPKNSTSRVSRASDPRTIGKSLWDFVVFSQAVTVRSTAGLCRFRGYAYSGLCRFFSGGDGAF